MQVLHLAHRSDWEAMQRGVPYRWSTRSRTIEQDGFVHCSTAEQLPRVAAAGYGDDPEPLIVLVVDTDRVEADGARVVFEDGGDREAFPHLLTPLRVHWVVEARQAWIEEGVLVT